MTTPAQVYKAQQLAREIEKIPGVEGAFVDDWSDYGSFAVFVDLHTRSMSAGYYFFELPSLRGLLKRIRTKVEAVDAQLEWAEPPRAQYQWIDGCRYYRGHDRDNYKLSIRILEFIAAPPVDPQLNLQPIYG